MRYLSAYHRHRLTITGRDNDLHWEIINTSRPRIGDSIGDGKGVGEESAEKTTRGDRVRFRASSV